MFLKFTENFMSVISLYFPIYIVKSTDKDSPGQSFCAIFCNKEGVFKTGVILHNFLKKMKSPSRKS